jgi:hypothetical protein
METALVICDSVKAMFLVNTTFSTEDAIVLYLPRVSVTLDYDIMWCRIHRDWVLQRAIDLGDIWHDPEQCSTMIIDAVKEVLSLPG